VWNKIISQCAGFERNGSDEKSPLPCYPSTVVYGHTASRGLDVHRWTMGIDTGCVCCTPLFPHPVPYDSCPRSTIGGLRHSFWIMRIHTRKTFPLALMMATTMTMTMTTTSNQANGPFLSVTTVKRGFSVSSARSTRCRRVTPFCLFRTVFGRACRSLQYVQYTTIPCCDVYSTVI
jgi:hypothetical protein